MEIFPSGAHAGPPCIAGLYPHQGVHSIHVPILPICYACIDRIFDTLCTFTPHPRYVLCFICDYIIQLSQTFV